MILKQEQINTLNEPEVVVRYKDVTTEVEQVIAYVKGVNINISCKKDGEEIFVNANDIYYIESVDKRCFVYCERDVFQTEYKLYELEERLESCSFIRVNKSCVLNLSVLSGIKPLINSRLEANLINGEKIYVSRKYLTGMKERLKESNSNRR